MLKPLNVETALKENMLSDGIHLFIIIVISLEILHLTGFE